MNIGEPIRELDVEPLLYPAALPEAPPEPTQVRAGPDGRGHCSWTCRSAR